MSLCDKFGHHFVILAVLCCVLYFLRKASRCSVWLFLCSHELEILCGIYLYYTWENWFGFSEQLQLVWMCIFLHVFFPLQMDLFSGPIKSTHERNINLNVFDLFLFYALFSSSSYNKYQSSFNFMLHFKNWLSVWTLQRCLTF